MGNLDIFASTAFSTRVFLSLALSETSKHPISNADTPVDFKTCRPETRSSQGPFPFFLNSCVSLIQNLRTLFWNFDRNPPIGRERGQILMGAEKKTNRLLPLTVFFLLVLSATIPCVFSAANQSPTYRKSAQLQKFGSSAVFPLHGNVYPLGYYSVSITIGHPAKRFDLDIDTGSDLTWVQCDAPCTGCTKPREHLYKPSNNLLGCGHPLCVAFHSPASYPCKTPDDQCDYEVEYADHGSSLGVLVNDYFPLKFTNGSQLIPRLAFGCGYDQKINGLNTPATSGVIGLANGKASIVSQLSHLGLTRNVVGHCLSGQGGGFLFFGDDLVPSSGVMWTPMLHNSFQDHYSSGPAELVFNGKSTGVKGLNMVFDSGSSYTYFNSQAYKALINLVRNDLNGKPLKYATEDQSLPICWKGSKPFKSVGDAKNFFKPLAQSFTKAKNVQLQLSPDAYLIVTKHGNVCLGILNGTEVGLGSMNIIGDITMQDKMVIYDNENQRIGWAPTNCKRLSKS
ncbi:aspartic proteinase Asp1-like isoform X2 [Malus domestica]|uniref:aspartic proteinase Asp1-like isoform X2 n=1 Tax=Malus domestica TaxID=3750 RepID=UPI0039748CA5